MTDSVSEFRELTESAVQLLFAAEAGLAIAAAASGYAAAGQAAGAGRNALTGSSALDDVYSGARGYWDDLFGAGCRMGNSFVPGTGVLMADGTTKPIEDVNVGDYVWATDPQSGEAGPRRVTKTIVGDGLKNLVDIELDGQYVTATDGHPFWVDDEGRWVDAGELRPGDELLRPDGSTVAVVAVNSRSDVLRVHNLTVTGIHTYYVEVGDIQLLTHNCSPAESSVWQKLTNWRGKTRTNGLTGRRRQYYQWDYTHGEIEVYNSRGVHLGAMDPLTGEMIKPAVRGRTIDVR